MNDSNQKIPKDHYVPQFYLDAFAIEGPAQENPHIFQYMPDKIVSPRIKDVTSERHFYTLKDKETGEDMRDLDKFLTDTEDLATGPLKKIIEAEEIDLEDKEFAALSTFFALLAIRTPGFINGQQSMSEETIKEMMALDAMDINRMRKSYEEAGIFLSDEDLKQQQKFVLKKEYSVKFGNKGYFLAQGLKVAHDLAQWYYERKHWHLLISDSERVFLTSDCPISIYRPIFVHPAMNAGYGNGTLFIPISPKIAILLRDMPHKNQKIGLNRTRVDEFNKNTARFSTNYVFSNLKSKQIHEMYKKTQNKEFQKIKVRRHKSAPYIFMGSKPVPEEPLFK